MNQTYKLVERINGNRTYETPPHSQHIPQSTDRALEWLLARCYFWQMEGFFMLHVHKALVATGYNPLSGECLVLEFEAVK